MRARLLAVLLPALALATGAAAQPAAHGPETARIITSDVETFWRAYDAIPPDATREDSVRAIAERYFAQGSDGLAAMVRMRIREPENLLRTMGFIPRYLAAVRPNTLRLHEVEPAIREGYRRFHALYPAAAFPDLYFVVGDFSTMGTLAREGLLVGAEMVSADAATPLDELPESMRSIDFTPAVIPCLVTHELVHAQQRYGPERSLLAQTLREGVADFLAELAAGCTPTSSLTIRFGEENEQMVWEAFQQEMHGEDFSRWFYNAGRSGDWPQNLGYWVGHRIAAAYYARAADREQAVHDMLHIQDSAAFLAASGYAGAARP